MRILITGGAGFIGFHLAQRLLSEQCAIALVDNFNHFYDPEIKRRNVHDLKSIGTVNLYETDILDRARLRQAFDEFRPDTIVHLAAWAGVRPSLENPELYARVNVAGTVNTLDFAKEFKIETFIFASSSSVYGGNKKVPFSEDDPVEHPVSPYAATKRAGELLCYTYSHNFGMNISCLRLFTVYGNGQSRRDYTYVDDIVSGIVGAIGVNPRYAILNLGESQTITLVDLIGHLERALERKAQLQFLPEQPGDMEITYADISRARRVLAYDPQTPIEAGIGKFAAWFKEQKQA
jgi:UDP-glucuronate 4-epimerase